MIYLDNAATSWPKPPMVLRAMTGTLAKLGGNPGRAGHKLSLCGGRIIERCRELLADYFDAPSTDHVIFTSGCTEALNLAIRGTLYKGDEVLCSHAEHNAVMRVLKTLEEEGSITVQALKPDGNGIISPETVEAAISPRTALCVLCHASNVTGVIQPVAKLSRVLKHKGVPLLVDAAQTAGILPVSLKILGADMIAIPGHKGLLGPHGTGILVLGEGMQPRPLLFGGTGSLSESMLQPHSLPDRYESGTLNLPGIAGLLAGARFVLSHRQEIEEYETDLAKRLRKGLSGLQNLRLLGSEAAPMVGVVSFVPALCDPGELSDRLSQEGFALRAGLHCAPSIHRWQGTLGSGACRASVGIYNTEEEIDQFLSVLRRLLSDY